MRVALPLLILLLSVGCASSLEKARTARDGGDLENARSFYTRAMEDPQLAPVARQELATMLAEDAGRLQKSDMEAAEALYGEALELDPVNGPALTGLVRLLRRRGRLDRAEEVLDEAAATGPCGACNRLGLVLLLDRGDHELSHKNWDLAIEHYTKAQKLRTQARPALAIANAHLMAGRADEATEALRGASPLMTHGDASSIAEFERLRRAIVMAALEQGNVDLADRARAIEMANEAPAERVALALLVADHLGNNGQNDDALARYEALLSSEAELQPSEDARGDLTKLAANIHANRATAHLHAGRGEDADAALEKAIELRPDDWVLKLQRVLAVSGRTGAEPALAALAKVPDDAVGKATTRAILLSQRVLELAETGNLEAAQETLTEAQQAYGDLPEVHLAAAWLVAQTPLELDRKERKAVKGRASMVRYRQDVYRFAEALGEIDWVRTSVKNRNKQSFFTAPWLNEKTDALEERIREVYPFAVTFRADPEPQLVLKNATSEPLDISLRGTDHAEDLEIGPADERTVTLPESGVVSLQVGKRKRTFYAEPYARVTLPLE